MSDWNDGQMHAILQVVWRVEEVAGPTPAPAEVSAARKEAFRWVAHEQTVMRATVHAACVTNLYIERAPDLDRLLWAWLSAGSNELPQMILDRHKPGPDGDAVRSYILDLFR